MWQANHRGGQQHCAAAERLGQTLEQPCGDVDPGRGIACETGHIHGVNPLQLSLHFTATSTIPFQLDRGRAAEFFSRRFFDPRTPVALE